MKISSKVHPQPGQVQYLVLDVTAGQKQFFAGVLIGDLRATPPTATDISNACLGRLIAAQDQCSNNEQIMLVEIRSPSRAKERVPQVCESIVKHGAAAFYCLDATCYDEVVKALNVDFQ